MQENHNVKNPIKIISGNFMISDKIVELVSKNINLTNLINFDLANHDSSPKDS